MRSSRQALQALSEAAAMAERTQRTHVGFDDNADFVPLERTDEDRTKKQKKKKAKKPSDGPMKRRSLFVTGLPEDATNEMVRRVLCSDAHLCQA